MVYDNDSNAIVFEPIKTRQAKVIFTPFTKCEQKIAKNNIAPTTDILDNECSSDLKLSIIKNRQQFQLVPPN